MIQLPRMLRHALLWVLWLFGVKVTREVLTRLPDPPTRLEDAKLVLPSYINSLVIHDNVREKMRRRGTNLYIASVYLETVYKRMLVLTYVKMDVITLTDTLSNAFRTMTEMCTRALETEPTADLLRTAFVSLIQYYKLLLVASKYSLQRLHDIVRLQRRIEKDVSQTGEELFYITM